MKTPNNQLKQQLKELRAKFIESLPARLAYIESLLQQIAAVPSNAGVLEEMYNAVHKLHGTAGSYGFETMSQIAYNWEKILDELREQKSQPEYEQLNKMRAYLHGMNNSFADIKSGLSTKEYAVADGMKNVNILVVEDDPEMQTFLSEVLKAGGYGVVTAENGEDALKMLKTMKPELILADVVMPVMNGYNLCLNVRKMGHDDIPFIFCSALDTLPERIKGLRVGADDYLVKPVNPEELLLKVNKTMEKTRKFFNMKRAAQDMTPDGIMQGFLTELGVAELLQLVITFNPSDFKVSIFSEDYIPGTVFIANRQILHAEIGEITGKKALFRLLEWRKGTFKIERGSWLLEPTIEGTIEQCILDGLSQTDEFKHLLDNVNLAGKQFEINYSSDLFKRHFQENTTIILSLVRTHHLFEKILNHSPLTDLETARIIHELLTTGIIKVKG